MSLETPEVTLFFTEHSPVSVFDREAPGSRERRLFLANLHQLIR
jgi:hypothetical protein